MAGECDVLALRDWLAKQPHLPQALEDRLLKRFLLSCDGSLERSKVTLETFFTVRSAAPEVFCNRDLSSSTVRDTLGFLDLLPLEGVTSEGYTCFLFRFADTDPRKFNFSDVMKVFFMVGDVQIRTELDFVPGLVSVFDMTGWSTAHLVKIPPLVLRRIVQYTQDCQPVKVKQIHMVNANSFMDKILTLIRPFISAESANLFHLHPPGSDSLYQHVPKDMLPEEYGGKGGSVKDIKERWKKKLGSEREWFLKDEWMADETKRINKPKRNGTLRSGMEGSFRSLSID